MVTWDFKRKSVKRWGYFKKRIKKNKSRKEKACYDKERQRRVVGPMNENHEVKIKKLEKHKGNVEERERTDCINQWE